MDWGDIERLIGAERGRGNVVAEIIGECRFGEGKMDLILREGVESDEEEESDEGEGRGGKGRRAQGVKIQVDLGLSAWANAREYFDKKKVAAEKVHPDLSPSNSPCILFCGS
jgi:hypothetical protein